MNAELKLLNDLTEQLDSTETPKIGFATKAKAGITRDHQRLGVLSASFNPLTNAHVEMCKLATKEFGFDEVLFLLAKTNADKAVFGMSLEKRMLMLKQFVEVDPEQNSYAVAACSHGRFVDKALALNRTYPPHTQLYFLLGADTLIRLFDPKYYDDMSADLGQLFELSQAVAFNRGRNNSLTIENLLEQPAAAPFASTVHILDLGGDYAQISSTETRNRIQRNEPIDNLVPNEVKRFISTHGLYIHEIDHVDVDPYHCPRCGGTCVTIQGQPSCTQCGYKDACCF